MNFVLFKKTNFIKKIWINFFEIPVGTGWAAEVPEESPELPDPDEIPLTPSTSSCLPSNLYVIFYV